MPDVKPQQQIIAMSGGGFSMEPENPLLDQYILSQCRAPQRPKVCFVPTASGDNEGYIKRFYQAFAKHPCEPSHLPLLEPATADLQAFVMEKDIIYVGGGNTKNLLALWREWKLDQILHDAWESGVLLCGVSAGSICWFEQGVTDSIPGELTPLKCLGFLPGSNCPHYDGEAQRRPSYQRLVAKQQLGAGYAADDGAALHFVGRELNYIVSSRPDALAYEVSHKDSQAVESPLGTDYLGPPGGIPITIRRARSVDVDAIAAICPSLRHGNAWPEMVRRKVLQHQCFIHAATGRVAGWVVLEDSFFGNGFISLIQVAEDQRRRGIGTELMRRAERECATPMLFTSTNQSNTAMRQLLGKLGYQSSGRIDNLDENDPELIYCKRLRP